MNTANDADAPAPPRSAAAAPAGRPRWTVPWMLWPLLAVVALLFLRRPDFFVRPQFWAEDGVILFVWARLYGWHSLFTPHPAYYIFAQRLVACATRDLPALYLPFLYCYAALAYLLLTVWFCLRARLDYLMDRRGRIALALALVLAPQSGEIPMVLIASQWALLPILFILIIQDQPVRRGQAVADFLGLALAGMTGPFIVFIAPFFLVRLRRVTGGRSWYNLALIGAAWVLAAIQLVTILRGPQPPGKLAHDPHLWVMQLGLWLPGGLFFGGTAPPFMGRLFFVISPALLALLAWALWRGERRRMWVVLALLGGGFLTYAGGLRAVSPDIINGLLPFGPGGRYFYPFYLAAVWAGIIYFHDASPRLRRASAAALVMMMLASASHFTPGVSPDLHWKKYAAKFDTGEAVKDVPLLPVWKLNLPKWK